MNLHAQVWVIVGVTTYLLQLLFSIFLFREILAVVWRACKNREKGPDRLGQYEGVWGNWKILLV